MKKMKRFLALLVSAVMVLAMGTVAFAADTDTPSGDSGSTPTTYTISTKSDDTHTYSVYQILTGDLKDGVLSNVVAGKNYNSAKGAAATAAEAIAKLDDKTEDGGRNLSGQALANAIAEYVNLNGDAYGKVTKDSPLSNVPAGYYLIEDKGVITTKEDGSEEKGDMTNDSYSTYIVKVVGNVEIEAKKAVPTFEKKIKDVNDTTGEYTKVGEGENASEWIDSADYDIGDAVPFQLKGTIPSNYDSYTTYYYQFSDQMEKSLTFNKDSVKVYVNGTEITTGFSVSDGTSITEGDFKEGTAFTVTFENLKNVTSVKAGFNITVEYTATLNENAVLGNQGNVNKAKLVYSNNPNKSGEGDNEHGETPWDNVIVFTYQTVVNKVDQDKKPLTGAEFTLYKKLVEEDEQCIKKTKEIKAVTADSGTQFTFKGLDDGDYVLKETKTPEGYNTAADIEFTITANHTVTWNGETRSTILTSLSGGDLGTSEVSTGTITTQVENKKGNTLPSTGGIGTTIFYVIGGILMVGAAVLLITKKRMSNEA